MVYDYDMEVKNDVYDYLKSFDVKDQLRIIFDKVNTFELCDEIRNKTDITEGKIYYDEAEECLKYNENLLEDALIILGYNNDPEALMKVIFNPSFADGVIRDYVLEHSVDCAKADLMYEYYQEYNQKQLKVLKEMIDKGVYYDFLVNPDLKAEDMQYLFDGVYYDAEPISLAEKVAREIVKENLTKEEELEM